MSANRPATNPIQQQLQLLLGGYGYNFYSDINKSRADDLLVRQHAGSLLQAATKSLAEREQEYRRKFVPPSTRENPYPSTEALTGLAEITRLKEKVEDVETRLRSLPVPTQDKIWWRVRDEATVLDLLLSYDRLMIDQAILIAQAAAQLTAQSWSNDKTAARKTLEAPIGDLEDTIRKRQNLLQMN